MSLCNLSDKLIAQVASHLNYSDVCNFVRTSKRSCRIVKDQHMDSIRLHSLKFFMKNGRLVYEAVEKSSYKKYCLKRFNTRGDSAANVNKILDECSSIKYMIITGIKMASPIIKAFNECKATFGQLEVCFLTHFDPSIEEFICFSKNFKKIRFSDIQLDKTLWCDKVLTEILPQSEFHIKNVNDDTYVAEELTDRTLLSLICDRGVQRQFQLLNVLSSFSIQGIVKVLKLAAKNNIRKLDWHLGVLNGDQAADAERYFGKDSTEMASLYKICVYKELRRTLYLLTDLAVDALADTEFDDDNDPKICFNVMHPE